MLSKHHIQVLQEDIDKANELIKKNLEKLTHNVSYICPIACALTRQFGEQWRVGIWTCSSRKDIFTRYRIPPEVREIIEIFDVTSKMEPFDFFLPDKLGRWET